MEFVSAIIGPIVESLIAPVKKQLGYLFSSTKHVRNMNAKIKLLDDTSRDVKNHMETNNRSNLEIPAHVSGWLEKVEKTKEKAQRLNSPSTGNGCFNMKMRYRAGRNAFKITEEMESLIDENIKIMWANAQKPLGKVKSNNASTSTPSVGDAQNHFKSREKSFKDALEFLQQDHMSKVIALCGMGGVGKTTMMEQLKKTVEDKKMFDWIVKVVIGQKTNMLSIQQAVAEYMGLSLTETSVAARADRLRITFGKMSERKEKILVILDDVWEMIELKDIGLSPLPNGFKLLLTSRYENICKQIGVEVDPDLKIVKVDVVEEPEAQNFFWQITGALKQHDNELNKIGTKIVRRCGFLPLAINLIASRLKFEEKGAWRDTLRRLENKNLDYVQESIKISYDYIKEEEEKANFLLCGLFPDDFNIPIEELTRYAWGLRLLNGVSTLGEARDGTETHVHSLKKANLLMDGDYIGCVKMHDLVLDFVLGRVSKCDHPWVINHGDNSKWSSDGMSEICNRISITCMGMFEFPRDFKYPNLSLLRLMDGDKSLKFPEAQLSEHLSALEVEFFDNSGKPVNVLFMELKRFKISMGRALGDYTGFKKHSFENTLMLVTSKDELLESRMNELFEETEVLYLEVDGMKDLEEVLVEPKCVPQHFFNNLRVLDVFKCANLKCLFTVPMVSGLMKLERLTISECPVLDVLAYSENGVIKFQELKFLKLDRLPKLVSLCNTVNVIELPELVELILDGLPNFTSIYPGTTSSISSNVSENQPFFNKEMLIPKLEILKIFSMDKLKEIWPYQFSSSDKVNACMLREIKVANCDNLVNLFPTNPMSLLGRLEELGVLGCGSIEVLFNIDMSCVGEIEEYSSNLRQIDVYGLGKLRELWRIKGESSSDILIRTFQSVEWIQIKWCERFVNVFTPTLTNYDVRTLMNVSIDGRRPCEEIKTNIESLHKSQEINVISSIHPKPFLNFLQVTDCKDVEVVFEIESSSSNTDFTTTPHKYNHQPPLLLLLPYLKELRLFDMERMSDVWKCNWKKLSIDDQFKCSQVGVASWFLSQYSKEIIIRDCHALSRVFPSYVVDLFESERVNNDGVDSTTNVGDGSDDTCSTAITIPRSANMTLLQLANLTMLTIKKCEVLEYIFTSSTLESLKHLKELTVEECKAMKVILKEDGEHRETSKSIIVFPRLKSLTLGGLPNIKGFFLGMNEFRWPVLEKVKIYGCLQMMTFTSGHSKAPKLNYIHTILGKHSLECSLNFHLTNVTHEHTQLPMCSTPDMIKLLQFPWSFSNLIEVDAHEYGDKLLKSSIIFPCKELLNLKNLEKVYIIKPKYVESTIEEVFEVVDETNKYVVVPKLKEVALNGLEKLKHMWKSNRWIVLNFPNLTKVSINNCPLLGHVFSGCMVGSLLKLQVLKISDCESMDVIVKQVEDSETRPITEVVFPCLKSITLEKLPNLKGFCLGKGDFLWPSLDALEIKNCPEIAVFTNGQSTTPDLKLIDTTFGLCHVMEDPNTFIKTKQQEGWQF
ncbi:unnamed protein product [Lactuca virosa]|uniref:NB-ARC domain-containing protein n=1 Tax=Lactuca virosa TaxID=75947 RepID=A0AAU9NF97_9ASTR|nr:unnamed protein product [Lactuca virosa]